jgi:hypothetical protein
MNHVEPIEVSTLSDASHHLSRCNTDPALPSQITKRVINGVYQGVTTVELDNLAAETAAYMTTRHPVRFSRSLFFCLVRPNSPIPLSTQDYAILAARIAISNLHKETKKTFSHVIQDLYSYSASCSSSVSNVDTPLTIFLLQSTRRTVVLRA